MSTEFSLQVVNHSNHGWSFALYQSTVDLGVLNAQPLAWLTQYVQPNAQATFKWSLDYSWVWSQTGNLKPGVTFQASQMIPTDPDSQNNQVTFTNSHGAFSFVDPRKGPQLGSLFLASDSTIPPGLAAVGIGMSNSAVFAVQAQPNTQLTFTPHPQYWIAYGQFTLGQVLDFEQITGQAQIEFTGGFSMTATLGPDNQWTVQPTG